MLDAIDGLDKLFAVVPWDDSIVDKLSDHKNGTKLVKFSEFTKELLPVDVRDNILASIKLEDTAIMVYTSGTTGMPKGVMLSHGNLISFMQNFPHPFRAMQDDLTFSFLPMAHIAERCISFYGRITYGVTACFCSEYKHLMRELDETRPTLFGAVPRIFEKAHGQIFSGVAKLPGFVQVIFHKAVEVGVARFRLEAAGKKVPLSLWIQAEISYTFLLQFIRRFFLGGRCAHFITGAAPIALDIIEFFWACKLPIYEVYGMSEATAATHLNHDDWGVKFGTVGKPIPSVETKIADDGEILIRCPWVFKGYYKNEEATRDTVDADGWLYTGDIGSIDEDGFLKITDRKKHIIITAGGKNIAPASIENAIKASGPLISQVVAHGDRRPYCCALIAPGPLETIEWGVQHKLFTQADYKKHFKELMADPTSRSKHLEEDMAKVIAHPEFAPTIKELVRKGNEKLMNVEQVKAFFILDRDLAVEHGEMTPTMKVKRKVVEQNFKEQFDRLYKDPSFGVHFSNRL